MWEAPADLRVLRFKVLPVVQSSHTCWKPLRLSWAHSQGAAGKRWDSHHQRLNILRPSGPPASAWEYGIPCKICFEEILKCNILLWVGVHSGLLGLLHLTLSQISLGNRWILSRARCWRKCLLSQLISWSRVASSAQINCVARLDFLGLSSGWQSKFKPIRRQGGRRLKVKSRFTVLNWKCAHCDTALKQRWCPKHVALSPSQPHSSSSTSRLEGAHALQTTQLSSRVFQPCWVEFDLFGVEGDFSARKDGCICPKKVRYSMPPLQKISSYDKLKINQNEPRATFMFILSFWRDLIENLPSATFITWHHIVILCKCFNIINHQWKTNNSALSVCILCLLEL